MSQWGHRIKALFLQIAHQTRRHWKQTLTLQNGWSSGREPLMCLHNHLLKPAPRLSLEFPYIKASPPKLTIFFHFWWENGNKVRVLSEWRVLFSPSKYHQFFLLSQKPQESYPGCTSLQTFTLCVTEYFVSIPKLKKAFCNWCLVLLLEFFSVAHQPSELEIA